MMRRPFPALLLGVLLTALSACVTSAPPAPPPALSGGGGALEGPVAVESRRGLGLAGASGLWTGACPVPPAPARDLAAAEIYADPQAGLLDPEKLRRNADSLKALHDFVDSVQAMGHAYLTQGDGAAGRCAVTHIAAWARGGALLGRMQGDQARRERAMALIALSMPFLIVRGADGADREAALDTALWFGRVGAAVLPDYANPRQPSNRDHRQNWAGAAVMLAGVAANDRRLYGWGIDRLKIAIGQIAEDGTLPEELAHGRRALHDHLYALTPLLLMVEVAARNQDRLDAPSQAALARLVTLAIRALAEPDTLAARAGAPQDPLPSRDGYLRLAGETGVWLELWLARHPDPNLARLAAASRPLVARQAGGDWTAYFGVVSP